MYKNKRYSRGNRGYRQFSSNRGRGRVIKTFDPSYLIEQMNKASEYLASQPEPEQPVEIKQTAGSFNDFKIRPELKTIIKARGYSAPTSIQEQAIPEILNGRDLVGLSSTGTGKTAAFLLPLINKILQNKQERVLIVAPTRELAVQIDEELMKFSRGLGIYSVVCIGGVNINPQIRKLQRRPQFVIGTPGRLLDLNVQRKLSFRDFRSVVLDEVDRMLDMGFVHDVQKIVGQLPENRQSLFFSATTDRRTEEVMARFLKEPVMISVQSQDTRINIYQEVVKINGQGKDKVLQDILDKREVVKTLVFVRTKRSADKLTRELDSCGFKICAIHGNKSQGQRQRSLNDFKDGRVDTLIATDVAARGIDVNDITHVINYDLPESEEDYIHRIGRTGRNGKKGIALSFVG